MGTMGNVTHGGIRGTERIVFPSGLERGYLKPYFTATHSGNNFLCVIDFDYIILDDIPKSTSAMALFNSLHRCVKPTQRLPCWPSRPFSSKSSRLLNSNGANRVVIESDEVVSSSPAVVNPAKRFVRRFLLAHCPRVNVLINSSPKIVNHPFSRQLDLRFAKMYHKTTWTIRTC